MPAINPQRLLNDLRQLRTFGAHDNGVVRLALSPIDMESRRWLVGRLTEAGLEARIDGIGTVFGRSHGKGRAVMSGSHTDTQPSGGWLDGAMGVIYGLEIARALWESPETRDLAVDVASWIDEEGTYAGFIGSRSFCGEPVSEVVARARNREGQPMSDALRVAGIAGQPLVQMVAGRYVPISNPIEQGGRLESSGKRIGVVNLHRQHPEFASPSTASRTGGHHAHGGAPRRRRRLIRFASAMDGAFRTLAGPQASGTSVASSSARARPASSPARRRWSCRSAIPRPRVSTRLRPRSRPSPMRPTRPARSPCRSPPSTIQSRRR
jgi:N-carbamoyl-L-amino-acid hydrolase